MEMEEEDAREILKQLQRRKSNFEYNLILLERRRKLREVCEYVDSLVGQNLQSDANSFEVEQLRARRLIHERLRQAEVQVVKNVNENCQKMEENVKRSQVVSKRGPQENASRLSLKKNHNCERCDKKRTIETSTTSRTKPIPIGGPKPTRPKTIDNKIEKNPPRKELVPFGSMKVVTIPPLRNPMISSRRLRVKQLSQSLKDKLRESMLSSLVLSKRSNNRVIIPLGVCQKNVVAQLTKETNTSHRDGDENISIETVVHDDGESDRKAARTLSVKVLPGVNVPGSAVVTLPLVKPRSSYKYVEVLHGEDLVCANRELIDVRVGSSTENVGVFRPLTPDNEENPAEHVTDETRDQLGAARQWLEQELVEYVLSQMSLEENVTELSAQTASNPSQVAQSLVLKTLDFSSEEKEEEAEEEASRSCSSSSSSISVPWVPSPDGTPTPHSMESGIPNPQPTPLDVPELPKDDEEEELESEKVIINLESSKVPASSPIESSVPANLNLEDTPINASVIVRPDSVFSVEQSSPPSSLSPSLQLVTESSLKETKHRSEHMDDITVNDTSIDPVTVSKDVTAMSQSLQDVSIGQVIPIRQLRNVAFNRQKRQWMIATERKQSAVDQSVASTLDETEELSFTDPSLVMLSEGEVRPIFGTGVQGSTVLWHRVGPVMNFFVATGNSGTNRKVKRDEFVDKSLGETSGDGLVQSPSSCQEEIFVESQTVDENPSGDDERLLPRETTTDPLSEGEVRQ